MEPTAAQSSVIGDSHRRSSRFRYELATELDDGELRQLLRSTVMEGDVRVTLRREPSFFQAAAVEGPEYYVLTARDTQRGHIVAMGAVSFRPRYVHGVAEPVGYLSGLRVMPDYRRGTLLAHGYRALRMWLVENSVAKFYLTTIASENRRGLVALTRRRADLPLYSFVGSYHSMVLPLNRSRRGISHADLQIRPLQQDELSTLIAFLQSVGRRRPFFPCYRKDDFEGRSATFLNLPTEWILTAWNGRELVGTLGLWDQMPFRQTVVEGYSPPLAWLRPVYNVWARLRRHPQFPRVGRPFRYLTAALPLVSDGDPGVFHALLAAAAIRSRNAGQNCLLLGMCTHDPLYAAICRQAVFTYATNVYAVSWDDKPAEMVEPFVDRDLYLELGCL